MNGEEKTPFQIQLEKASGYSDKKEKIVASNEAQAEVEGKTPFQLELEAISKKSMVPYNSGNFPVFKENPIAIANKINAEKESAEPGFWEKATKAWYNGWGTTGYSLGAGIEWAGFAWESKTLEDWGQSLKITGAEAMNKNEVPHLKDFEWKDVYTEDFWANKVPTILPSIITLAGISTVAGIPGKIIGSSLGALAGGGTGVAAGAATGPGAAATGAVGSAIGGAIGHAVTSALISRSIEGLMEAGGAREQSIQELKEMGIPEKEAKEMAGKAALEVFKKNYSLVGLDFTQFALAFLPKYLSGFKNIKNIPYKSLTKGQKIAKTINGIPTSLRIPSTVIANVGTEGFEEGYQQWITEQALRRVKGEDPISFDKFIELPETKEAIALGMVGGGAFAVLGEGLGTLSEKTLSAKKTIKDKNGKIISKATKLNDNVTKLSLSQTQKELENISKLMQNEFIIDAVAEGRTEEVVKLINKHVKNKDVSSRAISFMKEVKDNFDSIPGSVKSKNKHEILRSIYSKKEAETLIGIAKEEDSKKGIDVSITESKIAPLKERIANEDKLIKAFINPQLYDMLNDDLKSEFNRRTGKAKPTIPEGFRVVKENEVLQNGFDVYMNFEGSGINITNAPESKKTFTAGKKTEVPIKEEEQIAGPDKTESVEINEEYKGKVGYATPGAGKTTLVRKNPDKFIDGDDLLMDEIIKMEVPGMKGTKAFNDVTEKNLAKKLLEMWKVLGKEEAEALYNRALEKGKKIAKETGKTVLFGSQRLIPEMDFVITHSDTKRLEDRIGKGYKERVEREQKIIKDSGKSVVDIGKGYVEDVIIKKGETAKKEEPKKFVAKKLVKELFESNPELANQVYEALGFITKSKIETTKTPGEIINELFSRQERGQISLAGEDVDIISKSRNNPTEENIQELEKLYNDLIGNLQDAIVNEITPEQKQKAQQLYFEYIDSLNTIELHSKLGNKTESGNVRVVKNIFDNKDNKDVITAFRVDKKLGLLKSFRKYNAIGNPINWQGFKPRFEGDNATIAFMDWFLGKDYTDVEQEYRQEILNNLDNLKGKTIEYYKELGRPSHATALDYLINQLGSKQGIEGFKDFVQGKQFQKPNKFIKPGVPELFESNPELANQVYEALGFKQKSYVSKLKEISERRKLATKWDLENSQLIKDIRVDKTQSKELKPNAADNNLAAIMLYGMKMSELEDKGLPEEMMEATTLAYRILNDFMFNINEISFYQDILLENPEYAQSLTTNENPVKEFFEHDIFEQVEKNKLQITPQQKQQAQLVYSQYLETIFPDSKVKDIVYRNESKEKGSIFNNFRKDKENTKYDLGFYFTTQKGANDWFGWNQIQIEESEQQHKFDNKIFQYILNITNPKIQSFKEYFESNSEKGFKFFKEEVSEAIKNNNDALIARDVKDISNEEQFIVFEPEQIHILGGKQDIEGFKEFVNKSNKFVQESGSLQTLTPSKIENLQNTVEYQLLNEKDEDLDKKSGQSYIFLSEKDAERFTHLVEKNKEFPKEFKVTKKITKYEKDSKNSLKYNGYNEYIDFYYIKSNKNKKSNLYDIINKETGEVIASKIRVLSVSKDSKSEIAKKYGLEHTPTKIFNANRSVAFALYRQKPSKAKYIAQAKKYLYDAIKFLNPEETNLKIDLDKIEELLNSFPEEMWDYINTTYSPEDSTNINASISLQNEIKFNLPKLGFLQEIEKITGIKLLGTSFKNYDRSGSLAKVFKFSKLNGEWGSTITIDNSMTTKELKASIRYYLSTKNIFKPSSEEENVRKYAEHKGIDYSKLKELVFGDIDKALGNIAYNNTGNSDTIELSKWRESIRNYDWQTAELFSKPYENFQNTVKERIQDKFKDKNLSNGISHLEYFFNSGSFNWLNINFNNISGQYYLADMETEANVGVETKMGGIINPFEMKIYQKPKAGENFLQEKEVFNRLAAVLHEPFHALHALSYGTKEELELRKAFDNLYNTTFGKEMMNQVFGSGYNKGQQVSYDTLYKEFTAFTTQLMLYPKQWIKNTDLRSNDIYEFIEKIQTLQDKTYEEIIKTQQKVGTVEKTITEEEKIKLSFLEKLYNYLVKALNKIIPLSKKFTNLIVDSKLVEKKVIEDVFGEVEETVTKTLKLPDEVKKSKEQFLEAMEELQSAINTLMQIDGKLFSSENITNFFTSNEFNQEQGSLSNFTFQKSQEDNSFQQFQQSLNNPNTNPILQGNQEEQVKKFTELQERLNNKEFLEGAKNAYESSKGLQEFGTQEQYNDYIARVSLGIIKNPSSGDYNYTSQVKDIVYHGSDTTFDGFLEDNLNYFGTQAIAKGYGKNLYPVVIEINKPYYEDGGNLSNQSYEDLYDKLDESNSDGFISNGKNLFVPKTEQQIHILGSKQDIEGFKEFVEQPSQPQSKQKQSFTKTIKERVKKTYQEIVDLFTGEQDENEEIGGSLFSDGDQKQEKNKLRIRHLYKDAGIDEKLSEEILYNITHLPDFNESDILGEIEKLKNKDGNEKILGEHLAEYSEDELISLFAAYKSYNSVPFISLFNRKGKHYGMFLSNKRTDISSEIITTIEDNLNNLSEDEYNEKYKNYRTERLKQRQKYNNYNFSFRNNRVIGTKPVTQEMVNREKLRILETDIKFLEDITGVDWSTFLEGYKDKFNSYEDYYLHYDSSKLTLEYRNPLTNFVIKESLSGIKNNILKGGQAKTLSGKISKAGVLKYGTRFLNVDGNEKSGLVMESNLSVAAKNVLAAAGKHLENKLVQFWKKANIPLQLHYIEGIKNIENKEGKPIGELSSEDLRLIHYLSFIEGEQFAGKGKYLHPIEQFSDKKPIVLVPVKKHNISDAIKHYNEIKNSEYGKYVPIQESIGAWVKTIAQKMESLQKNGKIQISGDINEIAREFVYNYVINKHYSDLYFFGSPESYLTKDKSDIDYVDMVKRAGSSISTGQAPLIGIDGGVQETFGHVVINDLVETLEIGDHVFKDKEITDGGGFISETYASELNVSHGSVFDYEQSIKGIYSEVNENNLKRDLVKGHHAVLTKELAQMYPALMPFYNLLTDGVNGQRVDMISFKSTAKKVSGDVSEAIYEKGKIKEFKNIKVNVLKSKNFLIQQDLRHDSETREKAATRQMLRNFMQFENMDSVQSLINNASLNKSKKLIEKFEDYAQNPDIHREALLGLIADIPENSMIRNYITQSVSLNHPYLGKYLMSAMSSLIKRDLLNVKVNGGVYTPLPPLATRLKHISKRRGKVEIKNGKHIFKETEQGEMITFPAEVLVPQDSGLEIGEIVFLTRVPSDALHSTMMFVVKGFLPKGSANSIMMDPISTAIAGEDFDGDQRHLWSKYKNKEGDIIESKDESKDDKALMNRAFDLIVEEYSNADNFDRIVEPVDTEAIDKFIPINQKKNPNKYDPESSIEMYENNKDGQKTIGVVARSSAVYSYLKKAKEEFKEPIPFPRITTKDKGVISEVSIEEHTTTTIANNVNQAVDAAKLQNLKKMGMTEVHASMYNGLIMFGEKQEDVIAFFNHPMVKEYRQNVERVRSAISNETEDTVFYAMAEKIEGKKYSDEDSIYRKLKSKEIDVNVFHSKNPTVIEKLQQLKYLHSLQSKFRDLNTISKAIKATEESPKNFTEYYEMIKVLNSVFGNTKDLSLENRNLSQLSSFEPAHNNRILSSNLFLNFSIFGNTYVRNIITKFEDLYFDLKNRKGNNKLSNKKVETLERAVYNLLTEEAIVGNANKEQIEKDVIRLFNENTDGQNSFIELLTVEDGKLTLKEQFREIDLSERANNIKEDFSKLSDEFKDALVKYNATKYNYSRSTKAGGFSIYFDNKTQKAVGEKIEGKLKLWKSRKNVPAKVIENLLTKNPELIPTVVLQEYKGELKKGRLRIVAKNGAFLKASLYPPYVITKTKAGKFVLKLTKTYREINGKKTLVDTFYVINEKAKRIKAIKEENVPLPEENEYEYFIDNDDIPEIHYQERKGKNEELLSSDPELEAYMMSRLAEMFPDVKIFKNKKAFKEYVEKHVGPGKTVENFEALGAAWLDAMYINEGKAVQSTPFHELAHLYWDALDDSHPIKSKIAELYNTEEEAIQAIGEAVVKLAKENLAKGKDAKLVRLLKEFWKAIKKLFGAKSESEYVDKMANRIWNNKDLISAQRMRSLVIKYQDDVVENLNIKSTSEMEDEIEKKFDKSISDTSEEEFMYGISRPLLDEEQRRNAGINDTWRDQIIYQIRNKPEGKEPILKETKEDILKETEDLPHIQELEKEIKEWENHLDFMENVTRATKEELEEIRREIHKMKVKKENAIESYIQQKRKPIPKSFEEVVTEVFPIDFDDYLQGRISKHSKTVIDDYYKDYLREWDDVERIFWSKISSEEDLISKTKLRGADSAYAFHNRLSEMKTIANTEAITLLSDRIMKSMVIEDMKSEVGKASEDKKGTRMYYQMMKGGIEDDWSGNSWISGKYSLISPTLVREPILQYRERIYETAITEINAKQHEMRKKFQAANKKLSDNKINFEKEMTTFKEKRRLIIGKNSIEYRRLKKKGDARSLAIVEWIDLYHEYEQMAGGVSMVGTKHLTDGYLIPQVEMDMFEMLKAFGIDKTIEVKLIGDNSLDEITIDTSGLKIPGLGNKMTYGEAKKILLSRGKGIVGKVKILVPIKILEKRAKKAIDDGIDAAGNVLKMKDSKKIKLAVEFKRNKYATKNIPEVAIKYFDSAIFAKEIAPLLPILAGIKNYLSTGPNKMKNISNWLEMVEDNKIYGVKLESVFGPMIGSILQGFINWTHWKYLGLNFAGQIFNAMSGFSQTFVQIGPYRMIKGLYRLIRGFGLNTNYNQAFVHGTLLDLMRDLDVVNTSVDAELSISQRTFSKVSNFIFSPITFVEYINHAYSFLGMMENSEIDLIIKMKKEGKSSHDIQLAIGYDRILELKQITQRINGSYNPFAKRPLNQTPEGRALSQFKNWMADVFLAHFSSEHKDLFGKIQKGILVGVKDVGEDHGMSLLKKVFKANFKEFRDEWKSIKESDKVAIRKFGRELFIMGTLALIYASYDDDKKDEKTKLARMLGDVGFIYDLDNTAFFLDAPMPSLGTAADILRLTKEMFKVSFGSGGRYKRDTTYGKKGDLKVPIQIINELPGNKLIKQLYGDN